MKRVATSSKGMIMRVMMKKEAPLNTHTHEATMPTINEMGMSKYTASSKVRGPGGAMLEVAMTALKT
jgi:hypothetical protein